MATTSINSYNKFENHLNENIKDISILNKLGYFSNNIQNNIFAPKRDTFLRQLYNSGFLGQTSTRDFASYMQHKEIFDSFSPTIQDSANLYLNTGTKLLNQSILFTGISTTHSGNPLSSFRTLMSIAISQYQDYNSNNQSNTVFFTNGFDSYLETIDQRDELRATSFR
ncbi:hypothetical protein ACFL6P_05710 [Candidatus Latescibacterota bacterium]